MKSTTFARLALFLPYLILLESAVYFIIYDMSENDSLLQTFNIAWNFLAIFWFPPYTILVILLLARSKGKSFAEIKKLFLSAPYWLMITALATYTVVLIVGSIVDRDFFESAWRVLLLAGAVSIPASLILGYAFVGISLLSYKLLSRIGIIRIDDPQGVSIEGPDLQI